MTTTYDTVILGSSPNALTAAAYLARGGKRVLVLEPAELGGLVTTTSIDKDARGDFGIGSLRLHDDIVKDLKLHDHGLEVVERNSITSLLPDGRSFTLPADRDAATAAIAKFAPGDAPRYKPFMQLLDLAVDFLQTAYAMTPPRHHPPSEADVQQLATLVAKLRGYGRREMTEVMRLLVMSVRDLLDEWFENPELKGLLGGAAVRGISQGPFAAATTFNLLHQLATGDGYFRATAKGGIGAVSQALAKAAKSFGAEVRESVGPVQIDLTDGKASGVLVGSETIPASTVISDFDAMYTFTKLVPPPELEPEFNRAVRQIRYNGSVARINLLLNELPSITGISSDAMRGTLTVSPSLAYLERSFDEWKRGKLSAKPYMEITLPSLDDATLAPAGKHVMSIWMQYVPCTGSIKEKQVRDIAIDALSEYMPNIKSSVGSSGQVNTPLMYQSKAASGGHLFGGEINLAQAFHLRPLPGFADYRTPVPDLYICGSAAHPGGYSGLSGRNIARELGVKGGRVEVISARAF
jgi:phytoene dehydrogenase-like protein